ncbi:hypothetical protein HMPREF9374_3277 [Desmospora sp. 8437]|nr:hypothetical protein HMPREF9374_3277 [Desmospora sp. 8437]
MSQTVGIPVGKEGAAFSAFSPDAPASFDPPPPDQEVEQRIHHPKQDDEEKMEEEKGAKKDKQPDDQKPTPSSHPRHEQSPGPERTVDRMFRFQGKKESFPDVRIPRIDPHRLPQMLEGWFGAVLVQQEQPVIVMDVQAFGIESEGGLEGFPGRFGFLFFPQDPSVEGVIIRISRIQLQGPLNVVQCPIRLLAVLEEKLRVPIMDQVMVRIHPESLLKSFVRLGVFFDGSQKNPVKGEIQGLLRLKTDSLYNGFQRPVRLFPQTFCPGHQIVGTGMVRFSGQNFGSDLQGEIVAPDPEGLFRPVKFQGDIDSGD